MHVGEAAVQSSAHPRNDPDQIDPSRAYATPRALCEDASLSTDRKVALLRQWEYDLRSMQVATDESMTDEASSAPGANAEKLTEVRRCLRSLGDTSEERAQPNKQGGGPGDK
jgi:hypothetical protein